MKRFVTCTSQFNAHDISALRSSIEDACKEWLLANGFSEKRESRYDICVDDMMPSIWMSDYEDKLRVEVGMEIGYNSLLDLATNYLDPIVTRYDKNAYFDIAEGGLMVAYLN